MGFGARRRYSAHFTCVASLRHVLEGKGRVKNRSFSFVVTVLILCSFMLHEGALAAQKNTKGGFVDFNFYPYLDDVDSDSVVTLNIAADFNGRVSYFSLTNFIGQDEANQQSETATYYSEHNLRWSLSAESSFDLTVQSNFRSGFDNDRHRLGVRWRLNDCECFQSFFDAINLSYAINLHALQFDNSDSNVWQLEHAYFLRFPYISDRLYLAGFIDHTFNENLPASFPDAPIVAESQLGYELSDNFYAVVEYRINQYRREDTSNLAFGIQYKVVW